MGRFVTVWSASDRTTGSDSLLNSLAGRREAASAWPMSAFVDDIRSPTGGGARADGPPTEMVWSSYLPVASTQGIGGAE